MATHDPLITLQSPRDWQSLQQEVARVLRECGMETAVEKRVELGRGAAKIDVFAIEEIDGRTLRIAVECKNWQSAVTQEKVHAFRTVVMDMGCNLGLMVSRGGFQSGAYEAADRTCIELLTWEEFQQKYVRSWFKTYAQGRLLRLHSRISKYTHQGRPWESSIPYRARVRTPYNDLVLKHEEFADMLLWLGTDHGELPKLPVSENDRPYVWTPNEIVYRIEAFRELLLACEAHCGTVVGAFEDAESELVAQPTEALAELVPEVPLPSIEEFRAKLAALSNTAGLRTISPDAQRPPGQPPDN
jgi:hypothetical protein